jgi:hypothetical protein
METDRYISQVVVEWQTYGLVSHFPRPAPPHNETTRSAQELLRQATIADLNATTKY